MGVKDKDIVIFDVEATGLDRGRDQIIELSIQFGLEKSSEQSWRIKPSVPITPGAEKVHGISMEELKDCKPFSDYAEELQEIFSKASVVIGYNVQFDLDMLQAEFIRAGYETIDMRSKSIVDPLLIWRKQEPRALVNAYQRFVGGELEGAHGSAVDVKATGEVLQGMLESFGLAQKSWKDLAEFCGMTADSWIGPSKHFQWQSGEVLIGFGKHTGLRLVDLAQDDGGSYLKWIMNKDFPKHVKDISKAALNKDPEDFKDWVTKQYSL